MNIKNTLKKIEGYEKFGSVLGLERIKKLMEMLENPEKQLRFIHVAGTNGKGSVCRFIYEGLRSNGYKVGIYTSPFLQIFNERIEFDGKFIDDESLTRITEIVIAAADKMVGMGYESPTEFEIITAIAFVYFKEINAEFVVLEVGLGGKGDSTNIIDAPLISVITSISYDHMDRLGDTLVEIAEEKSGIIKKNVPVVINVSDKDAAKVIAKKAYALDSQLYDGTKVKTNVKEVSINGSTFDMDIYGTDYSEIEISMAGNHQIENAKVALMTLEILRKRNIIKVERTLLYEGIKRAKQIGRFEIISNSPLLILDGAHNQEGAEALARCVNDTLPKSKILVVTGILEDKDSFAIIKSLSQISNEFIATEPINNRKMTSGKLCDIILTMNCKCTNIKDLREVCRTVFEDKKDYDAVIFAGSLYLIGEVRSILKNEWKC